MALRQGKISPLRASQILGVHRNSVINWCRRAVKGLPSRLRNVERHPVTGYYALDSAEVRRLKLEQL